jgi:hypothetical protein
MNLGEDEAKALPQFFDPPLLQELVSGSSRFADTEDVLTEGSWQ